MIVALVLTIATVPLLVAYARWEGDPLVNAMATLAVCSLLVALGIEVWREVAG